VAVAPSEKVSKVVLIVEAVSVAYAVPGAVERAVSVTEAETVLTAAVPLE
jgi:hypothetical protein